MATVLRAARAPRQAVLSLDKALAILGCFEDGVALGVAEISRRLGLHPTIVSRMLATLESAGYVQQLGERGKYVIGIQPLVLANAAIDQLPLRRTALPVLQMLADTYHVDANLGILHEGLVLYLAHVPRDPALRAHVLIGKRVPVHCTGLGKALLLGMTDAEVREIVDRRGLEARTPHTLTSLDALLEELRLSRERGFTTEREEVTLGGSCVAAPLWLDAQGGTTKGGATHRAGISASVPAYDLTEERLTQLSRAVMDAAFDIARMLR